MLPDGTKFSPMTLPEYLPPAAEPDLLVQAMSGFDASYNEIANSPLSSINTAESLLVSAPQRAVA
ncbi:hypothetical protein [Vibrio aquimaris]|uniref:Uncharacterized protein n=1 Tax=Vibrio aquimaris TaxID=2587862 RepID=A0A5P9CIP5_9VIBR|nr:hypothetical protein [Vibrio aquimaris]QFT25783.1 hypothetical protein FIV01_05030 [Vibrio aquimaris]